MFSPRNALITVGLLISLSIMLGAYAACATSDADELASIQTDRPAPTPEPKLTLIADASNGIQQFVGGETIPVGKYFFDCDFGGNVSIQSWAPPYTISMEEGDQTQDVKQGDFVTVGWCKVWGEVEEVSSCTDFATQLAGAVFDSYPKANKVLVETFQMTHDGSLAKMQMDFISEDELGNAKTLTAYGTMDTSNCSLISLLIK